MAALPGPAARRRAPDHALRRPRRHRRSVASRSAAATSPRSSAPTAPARPRSSIASPASTSRPSGRLALSLGGARDPADVAALTASGQRSRRRQRAKSSCSSACPTTRSPHAPASPAPSRTSACFPGMTVLENLMVAQHNALMLASGWTVLGLFGAKATRRPRPGASSGPSTGSTRSALTDRADDPAGDLPYGAQRRLEIARAMCTEPVLLCLDEPAAGLNPRESAELNAFLQVDPRRARDVDPADRARHVGRHGDLRPRGGARVRGEDRRRHARRKCATIPR